MNRIAPLAALVPGLFLASVSLAQNELVLPPGAATTEGNSLDIEPFGYDRIAYVHYADQSLLRPIPTGALITRIAYRRDFGTTGALPTMQRTPLRGTRNDPIWEVFMRNFTGPVLDPSPELVRAGTTDWSSVFTPRIVVFPDLPIGPGPTSPFDVSFLFDRPIMYTGASLGVAHYAYETVGTTYNYIIDAVVSESTIGSADLIGPATLGCPPGQNRCAAVVPNPGGGNLEFYLLGGKPMAVGAAFLGTNTSVWQGLPLPLPLDVLGLTGCSVYTDLAVSLPAMIDIAGIGSVSIPVPARADLRGATLYGQWVARDDRVNPSLPLATSDGMRFTLGANVGAYTVNMSVVSGAQNLAQSRTGLRRIGEGPVFRLSW